MRDTLYIRLRAADPGAPTAYCIARPDAVASFAVNVAPLETVLLQAAGQRLVVFVPCADVRLTAITLPARQAAKALQAAPFALEDQLADDIDTLHFSIGKPVADRWPVAVVARERIEQWLAIFAERGLRPDALIPDVLALPVPAEGHYSLLSDGEQVLVRTALDGGFVCQREDLSLCLQIADPDNRKTLRALVPRGEDLDLSALGRPVEPLHGFGSAMEALLQNQRAGSVIDLLQGEYSQRQDWMRLWRPWRAAAALLLGAVLLGAALNGLSAWKLGQELQALETQNIARYQQVFPQETRIVDLASQLDQQAKRVNGGGGGQAMLSMVDALARAQQAVPGLSLQTLQYRDGALFAGLTGSSLDLLEKLKAWFAESRAAALEVQSANAGADGVQIRIRLTPL